MDPVVSGGSGDSDAWDTYLVRLAVCSQLGVLGSGGVKNQACMALCHALVYSVQGDSMRVCGGSKRRCAGR